MSASRANGKILPIEALARLLDNLRTQKSVVLCHGVFDLLHIGHIRYLEQAKSFGGVLVATITEDRYVNKGPHRPAFTQDLRAEALAALDCVDYVAISRWPTAVEAIRLLRPHLYVKGSEYRNPGDDPTGMIVTEAEAVRQAGGEIRFTEDITFSSSNLINRYYSPFPDEVRNFLSEFTRRFAPHQVTGYLEGASRLRILALGETIIDEYHYCETMGKSGKEPILATRFMSSEKFAGGVLAVTNHLAAFSDQVSLVSFLGDTDSHEEFIRQKLNPSIRTHFFVHSNAPTIIKRRFVETYPLQKLFEVYTMNGAEERAEESRMLREKLADILPDFDLVVVADYGHGMLDRETVDLLCERSRFLAVNVQVNAGNYGFNTVSKYPRADFVCISEREIRLEARSRLRPLEQIVEDVAGRLSCDRVLVTQGKQGCLCYERREGFTRVPALTSHVVDRIGAGDTVLSVASLCVAQGAPMVVAGFVGNAAATHAVSTMCNAAPLAQVPLAKHIISLLK